MESFSLSIERASSVITLSNLGLGRHRLCQQPLDILALLSTQTLQFEYRRAGTDCPPAIVWLKCQGGPGRRMASARCFQTAPLNSATALAPRMAASSLPSSQ